MRQKRAVEFPAVEKSADRRGPLSILWREVGLAAVAAELGLSSGELEPSDAQAVERGAAVVRLAGAEPRMSESVRRGRPGEEAGGRGTRRVSAALKRSSRRRTRKAATVAS